MIKNEMNTATKTTVKYNHILAEDYIVEADFYGQPVIAKAGMLMRTTKRACLYKDYFWGYLATGIERYIPGDLVKVVKVTTTTTTVTEEEDVVWE